MDEKICIIIAGPTAVGKTALAMALAREFGTQIISADSRQCYRELNIGVAKPSEQELAEIPHYFINSHSIHQECNAADFGIYARNSLEEIFSRKPVAVMVGGTGLYIRAFRDGLDEIPAISEEVHGRVKEGYKTGGLEWLQGEVGRLDPAFASGEEIRNPHRMIRALEVLLQTGQSIRRFQQGRIVKNNFRVLNIGLEIPREDLYARINQRVDLMMDQGLLQEASSLNPFRSLKALQTVGYRELFEFLEGKTSLDNSVDKIKVNSRHYAKRQLTWFHRDTSIQWKSAVDLNQVISEVKNMV
jgi:tRNA dimethylallyltransferase